MTLEKLHEATRQSLLDLERQIRTLRYELHAARAEIGDLHDRLNALEVHPGAEETGIA